MIKKTTLLCSLMVAASSILFSQTQQGHVRTLERPDKAGVALEGVTVWVQGEHNAVVSGKDGRFQMPMTGKRNGDSYALQQVQKNGYELADQSTVGRRYAYSDRVPLTIVMVSTAQLQADKRRIENVAYQTAERNYHQQLDDLERQLSDSAISEETYRTKLQQLQENLERYQSLIESLADHYAHTDYALLDEKECEVNLCIERGDLEKADSLLATMFNPLGVLERNREALSDANRRMAEGQGLMEQAQNDLAAVLHQQEKDAEYLYQLFTIALSRFDNEKARYYIETRAALDTTNTEWQNEAGKFLYKYVGDYDKAMAYFNKALFFDKKILGNNHPNVAALYNNIGSMYIEQGELATALEYQSKALSIRKSNFGEDHPDVETSYNNIGLIYIYQGDYVKALEYHTQALSIREKVLGKENPDVANTYLNIGAVYLERRDYVRALESFTKALAIQKKTLGEIHPDVATSYNNIGGAYFGQGNYDKALNSFIKALAIREKILVDEHPEVASVYNNIGDVYAELLDFTEALNYYNKALSIREKTLGKEHPDVAASYNNIGSVYSDQGNYTMALEYYNKAISIFEKKTGKEHLHIATLYNNIGFIYSRQGEYTKALEFQIKTNNILEKELGQEHPDVATSYNNIGNIYSNMGDYAKAWEYYNKTLHIREKVLEENHIDLATSYGNMGIITYVYQDNKDKALEYLNKALLIYRKTYGENHPDTKKIIENIEYLEKLN